MDSIIKTGGSSVVIGEKFFSGTFGSRYGKVLKISKITPKHNEVQFAERISTIRDFDKYYIIPSDLSILLKPSDKFYSFVKNLVSKDDHAIFNGNLHCCFVDYGGEKDLLDTINDISDNPAESIWNSYTDIIIFAKHILEGLLFLHEKQIAHLDIKPENIMVNCKPGWSRSFDKSKHYFKIIDFGFASTYPFDDYIKYLRGTPGYIPRQINIYRTTPFLPKIIANDFTINYNGNYLIVSNRSLIYKVDSFCFGRVLYFLRYIYEDNRIVSCFDCKSRTRNKLEYIIESLIEPNVIYRKTPLDLLKFL